MGWRGKGEGGRQKSDKVNEKGWSVEREGVGWRGKGEGGRQKSDKVNEKG